MNPLIKVAIISAGLVWALIFAMAIPMSVRTFANRVVKNGLRNAKRGRLYTRRQTFAPQDAMKLAGCPATPVSGSDAQSSSCFNFPSIPCFFPDNIDLYKHGKAEPTYEELARDPLAEDNWRANPDINIMYGYDCILSQTPYSARAWCVRPLVCYPLDTNATTCDCWWYTLSLQVGKRFSVKRNANRKITTVINWYTHDTQTLVRKMTINSHGMWNDISGIFTPGQVWVPSWDEEKRIGTTSYFKSYCNKYYNLKECFLIYVSEDLRAPKKVTAPVGMIVISVVFLGLDLLVFMVLFAISGGAAKVGPAK